MKVWFPGTSDGSNANQRWAILNGASYATVTPSLTSGGNLYILQIDYHQYALTPYYTVNGGGVK